MCYPELALQLALDQGEGSSSILEARSYQPGFNSQKGSATLTSLKRRDDYEDDSDDDFEDDSEFDDSGYDYDDDYDEDYDEDSELENI
ncbi:hypothetical protein BASA81_008135 [Batrachochytrium salamandrivorans]|nr:hypothetical protein BASA81_008135 [Batrachochytrium salamandrivorans]